MNARLAGLYAPLALAITFGACRDSSTGLLGGAKGGGPRFATTSDTGGGGGPGNQIHFVANGNFASVDWFVSDSGGGGGGGFTSGTLSVSRGGPTNSPQTFLFYFTQRCDVFFNCQVFGGNGLIPNQDFGGGAKSLQLNTNTSGNPNFFTFAGPPGLVAARWDANGFFQQRFSGTSEFSVPGFKQQSNGVSSSASANTTGSVIGVLIPPSTLGSLGSNTNVILAIFH